MELLGKAFTGPARSSAPIRRVYLGREPGCCIFVRGERSPIPELPVASYIHPCGYPASWLWNPQAKIGQTKEAYGITLKVPLLGCAPSFSLCVAPGYASSPKGPKYLSGIYI